MKTLEEIKNTLKRHKEEVIREYKVKEIGIFGSIVRGEQKKRSDIDILVEYYELPDLLKLIELERRLQRILKKKVVLSSDCFMTWARWAWLISPYTFLLTMNG